MKLLSGKVILLVLGLAVGLGGGVGASRMLGESLPFLPQQAAAAVPAKPREPHGPGIMFPTRERVVNLADPGIMRYLKTTIVLEMDDPASEASPPKGEEYKKRQDELAKELRGPSTVIDDQITAILSSKTSTELLTAEGKQHLKEEIKARVNKALGEERVLAVYFSDFIIQ